MGSTHRLQSLQTDPIGYEDQMNLYNYVGNDPVNFSDPSGLGAVVPCEIVGTCNTGENENNDSESNVDEIIVTGTKIEQDDTSMTEEEFKAFLKTVLEDYDKKIAMEQTFIGNMALQLQERVGEVGECVANNTYVPEIAVAYGVSLTVSAPIVTKKGKAFGGFSGPSGNKTSVLSATIRKMPGAATTLPRPSMLRGHGSGTYGGALGRVASKAGGQYAGYGAAAYSGGAATGCYLQSVTQ